MRCPSPEPAPGLHPAYLRLLLLQLKRAGLSTEALLSRAGIDADEVEADAVSLDVGRVQRMIATAVEASGRPWLGLEFGAGVPVLGHGPLGLAAAASARLREALDLIARFLQLRAPLIQLHLSAVSGGVWAEFRAHEQLQPQARLFVLEASLLMLERLLQGLSAGDFAQARIELPWPRPAWARHYPRFFASPVRFEARTARLWLPAALADAPCLSADPAALAFARAECERRLADADDGLDAVAALRRRLLACDGNYPDAATVAAELGLSLRSFFRLLAQEGVRWRGLLDEARRQRALQLLRETELSVERIAERLGYADASNFSRCLRRWYGRSARELRG